MSVNEQSVPWLTTTVIIVTMVVGVSAVVFARDLNFLALTDSGSPEMVAMMLVISFGLPLGLWIWLRRTGLMVVISLLCLTGALLASISGSAAYWWAIAYGILGPVFGGIYHRRVLNASRELPLAPTDSSPVVPPN